MIGLAVMVGVGIFAAGHLKAVAERSAVRQPDAYTAAKAFVLKHPAVKSHTLFSPLKDTLLEPWGPRRWRVTGRAETRDSSGSVTHVVYTCVVGRDSDKWVLEDISVQLQK